MANYPVYSYGSYQNPYYLQPMQGQMNTMPQPQQIPNQMIQPTQMVQPMMQPAQQNPVGNSNQNSGIIWVQNYAAANEYLVAANNAVALWDSSAPYVYLKQADSTGKPTIKVYELVERDQNQQNAPQQQIQLPDFNQFVKQDDIRGFVSREELEDIIAERLKKPSKTISKKEEVE